MPTRSRKSPHNADRKPIRPYRTDGGQALKASAKEQTSKIIAKTPSNGVARRVDRLDTQKSVTSHAQSEIDTAVRIISETAHDLRSPLASVAATLEIISEGELGEVSDVQADCLRAALRQCEYLNTLVGEMQHADGLLNGMTTLRRRAVSRLSVQRMVTEATAAVLASRRIELLFDGSDLPNANIFVDPALLCRLLVNLVINAQRASKEGSHILIRIKDDAESGVARWSVSDCGDGISTEQMDHLRQGRIGAGAEGTGLGLMICRQLAAMQFSDLRVDSRLGSGTDVTFETPLAQPTAIATAYSRFRSSLIASQEAKVAASASVMADDTVLVDQSDASSWASASLGYAGVGGSRMSRVAIGSLNVDGDLSNELSDTIDAAIQSRLGRFELSYRSTRRSWVWVFNADHRELEDRVVQIGEAIGSQITPNRLSWGEHSVIPVSQRVLQRTLVDRITKQSLSAATVAAGSAVDCDEVRLGTQPIATTPVAASRLDDELQRMASRLKSQSRGLQSQSENLRPNG